MQAVLLYAFGDREAAAKSGIIDSIVNAFMFYESGTWTAAGYKRLPARLRRLLPLVAEAKRIVARVRRNPW